MIIPNDLQDPILANLLEKYPHAAPSLFQAYNDIVYGQTPLHLYEEII
jgi:hypothetical protein